MGTIQSFFVQAKHWQVFTVIFGLFCCTNVVLLLPALNGRNKGGLSTAGVIAVLVFYGCFAMWYWSMASFVQSSVKAILRPSLRFYRFAISYPLVYLLLFNLFFEKLTPAVILVIFPFHLLALFCLFYTPGFITKNLAAAETEQAVRFRDYAGALFLLWFFPIGIWFIQPRINRLYAVKLRPLSS